MRVNQIVDGLDYQLLEAGLMSETSKPRQAVVVLQNELAPSMRTKCIKCSLVGMGLITLGGLNIAVVITKKTFSQNQTPALDDQFTALTGEYLGFASGMLAIATGLLAIRSAMVVNDSQCLVTALAVTAVATSVLGLFVGDYFS